MNTVDPKVLDMWIAFMISENKTKNGDGAEMTPEQAKQRLQGTRI